MALVGTRMRIALVTAVGILAAATVWAAEPAGGTGVGKDMRILYVGEAGSARAKDFVDFLSQHFGTVTKEDWTTFTESRCADFDVTILDHALRPVSGGASTPLSPEFSHPIITVGMGGALVARSSKLKTGYM